MGGVEEVEEVAVCSLMASPLEKWRQEKDMVVVAPVRHILLVNQAWSSLCLPNQNSFEREAKYSFKA